MFKLVFVSFVAIFACCAKLFADYPSAAAALASSASISISALGAARRAWSYLSEAESDAQIALGAAVIMAVFSIYICLRSPQERRYRTIDEAVSYISSVLPDGANVVFYIDLSASNWMGGRPSLHALGDTLNPYQIVMTLFSGILGALDSDQKFHLYGFAAGGPHYVFNFFDDGKAHNTDEVMARYKAVASDFNSGDRLPGGYTSFAELVDHASSVSKSARQFTVAVVIGDGAICQAHLKNTTDAVRRVSKTSRVGFIFAGVGNGPWADMKHLDDMSGRGFDNWQSLFLCNYHPSKVETRFPLDAVSELASQVERSAFLVK